MSELTVTAVLRANVDNFTKGLSAAKAALGELTNSNKSGGMTSIAKSMFGAQLAAQGVSKVIGMVSSGMGSMVGELNDSSKAWQTFEGNMKMLGKSSGEIDSTRKSLQDFAGKTIYSASDMASTFSQMAAIGYEDSEKLVKGMGGIAAAAENPQQAMKSMSQQITQAIAPFIPDITRMVSVVVSNIPRIISSFGEFAESVGKAISEIITSVSGLLGQIGPILTSAGQMFRDLGTGVKTAFGGGR